MRTHYQLTYEGYRKERSDTYYFFPSFVRLSVLLRGVLFKKAKVIFPLHIMGINVNLM